MIGRTSTKQLYESLGAGEFIRRVYHGLGLANEAGRRHYAPHGNPLLKPLKESDGALRPEEFSIRDCAEAIIGEDWAAKLNPSNVARAALLEAERPLLEAGGTGMVQATDFIDISAFTAVVTGLFEVTLLEAFTRLEFIADELAPPEPTKVFGGKKVIGAGGFGDKAEERKPGMPTKRAGLSERWIQTPETMENALSCEVTQEVVYLDQTGAVIAEANDIGYWLGYRKDLRVIDCYIGVTTATQFNYKGTTYSTYLSTPGSFYINAISGNELVHWTNVETDLIAFREMLDPETNTRVTIQPDTVLVNLEKMVTARTIFGDLAGANEYRDAPGSTTNPQLIRAFNSPYKGQYKILTSPLVYNEMIAASGLGLSATAAGKAWFMHDSKGGGPFRYAQNWPLRVQTAPPTQMDMIDRGIVLFIKADERGNPYVREPRKAVRNYA